MHYKINSWFWPIFWPKKHRILTEISHFDRILDRKPSVEKTVVEIIFWPVGQKISTEFLIVVFGQNILTENIGQNNILTDILTVFSVKIENFDRIFGQNWKFWPKYWPKISVKILFWPNFRSKFYILTENSVKIRSKFWWAYFKKSYLQNSYYSYFNNYSVIIIYL